MTNQPKKSDNLNNTVTAQSRVPWRIEFRVMSTPNVITVPVVDEMLVGRPDPKADVIPEFDVTPYGGHTMGVSRRHAMIRVVNRQIMLEDLDSANGTYINENKLGGGKAYHMRDRDMIRFGHMRLQVHYIHKLAVDNETHRVDVPRIGQGERVLVVDDDRNVADMIAVVLRHAGFKVVVKYSAVDAMDAIDHDKLSGIITELVLPDKKGLDVVTYARQRYAPSELPILVVSSDAVMDDVLFVSKPIVMDALVQAIVSMQISEL